MKKISLKCRECGSEKFIIFSRLQGDVIRCLDCGFYVDAIKLHEIGLAISRNNLMSEYQGTVIRSK